MAKAGRPSEYNEAIAVEICSRISEGQSLRTIGESEEMPSAATIFKWLARYPDFVEQYARARDTRAHARFENIDQVAQDLRDGKIDPNTARVLIDTIKWQCGKECAKRYGDRTALEHSGPGGAPLTVTVELVKAKVEEK